MFIAENRRCLMCKTRYPISKNICVPEYKFRTTTTTTTTTNKQQQQVLQLHLLIVAEDIVCPKGKRRCPGSLKKICIPEYKFCDGVPDCRGGTEEDPRYCREFAAWLHVAYTILMMDQELTLTLVHCCLQDDNFFSSTVGILLHFAGHF